MYQVYLYTKNNKNLEVIKNFKLEELACKDPDIKDSQIITLSTDLLDHLSQFRETYKKPITVTSCYRTKKWNESKEVKGATYSQHLFGEAVDFLLPKNKKEQEEFVNLCEKIFPKIIVSLKDRYIHCAVESKIIK